MAYIDIIKKKLNSGNEIDLKYNGAIPSPYDGRDYTLSQIVPTAGAAVIEDEYENPLGRTVPVFDQGESNMCVACSLSITRWLTEAEQSDNKEKFSPTFIYFNRDGSDVLAEGMVPREALKHLRVDGVCFEKTLSGVYYFDDYYDQFIIEKEKYTTEAKPYRISSYYKINGINEIKNAIKELGCVSIMVPVYLSLYNTLSSGTVRYNPKTDKTSYGNHQMTLYGWNDKGFIGVNSWGTSWGNNGHFVLPYEYPIVEAWAIVDEVYEAGDTKVKNGNYEDIKGHWGEDVMERAINGGIIVGVEDEHGKMRFEPDRAVTRCEFVTVLDRLGLIKG